VPDDLLGTWIIAWARSPVFVRWLEYCQSYELSGPFAVIETCSRERLQSLISRGILIRR
jgi:hypothetical protein